MAGVKFKGNIISFSARAPGLDPAGNPREQRVRTKFCIQEGGERLFHLAAKRDAARGAIEALIASGGKIALPPSEEQMRFALGSTGDGEVQDRRGFLRKVEFVAGEIEGDTALTFDVPYERDEALWTLDHLGEKLQLEVEPLQGELLDDPALLQAAADLAPKPGSGIDRVELSVDGPGLKPASVVLDQAAGKRLREHEARRTAPAARRAAAGIGG